jgi:hypothetical protein
MSPSATRPQGKPKEIFMQTWAKRGMQTALVTGGLLVLGTSIASASENVNPDRPAPPIDGGFAAPTHIGNEEADAPTNTNTTAAHTATQALPGDAVAGPITQVQQVIGTGLTGGISNVAGSHAGSEWPVLSGNLADAPAADPPAADLVQTVVNGTPVLGNQPTGGALLRVPLDVVGQAVAHRPTVTAPQSADGGTQPQFGPLDSADSLLRADQVPVLGDLFTVPNLRNALPGAPLSTLDQTRQMPALGSIGLPALSTVEQTRQLPVIGGLSTLLPTQRAAQSNPAIRPAVRPRSSTQDLPVSSHYQPMSGELPASGQLPTPSLPGLPSLPTGAAPVSANLPTLAKPSVPALPVPALPTGLPSAAKPSIPAVPSVPSLSALPDLPPVPTLPAMPPIPGRPTTQDLPALPGLATPSLPTPSLTGPSVPSLAQLPALPSIPGRPTTHDLPATPALPIVSASSLFTPIVPAVPAVPALPEVAVPQVQDVPAGSAQQLMAQLRTLITDLENSASGAPTGMHPMQGLGDIQPPAL